MNDGNNIWRLAAYMRYRAHTEGVAFELSDEFLQLNYDAGIRVFFGVLLNEAGDIIEDAQNPAALKCYISTLN